MVRFYPSEKNLKIALRVEAYGIPFGELIFPVIFKEYKTVARVYVL
jgi:hypothetical protein